MRRRRGYKNIGRINLLDKQAKEEDFQPKSQDTSPLCYFSLRKTLTRQESIFYSAEPTLNLHPLFQCSSQLVVFT